MLVIDIFLCPNIVLSAMISILTVKRTRHLVKNTHCSYTTATRFFIQTIKSDMKDPECIFELLKANNIFNITNGMVTINHSKEIIPILNNKLQLQYTSKVDRSIDINAMVCGFHGAHNKEQEMWEGVMKPVDFELMSQLDQMLIEKYPYIPIAALDDDYSVLSGTPPARIYRSFIRKREDIWRDVPDRNSVDSNTYNKYIRGVIQRVCVQIDLSYRQL